MKTIAPAAMAAIEAGEAIVTGAVEIGRFVEALAEMAEGTDVVLSWKQNTFVQSGGNDEARMGIGFLDGGGVQIGTTTWATFAQPTVWTTRSVSAESPAGATTVRMFMEMQRLAGANNDGFIDSIDLKIGGRSVTIVNPGAELGTTGWTSIVGGLGSRPGAPPPAAGSLYFFGGTHASTVAYQDYSQFARTPATPLRVWGGNGPLEIDGHVYLGIGDRGLVQQTSGAIGGFAQGLTLALSGIEPEALPLLDADEIKGAPVVVRRLIFAGDGRTMLDATVFDRGRVDTVETNETIGGEASVRLAVESAARGLGSRGARMRSDSDQRLINGNDGYFRKTAYAGEKALYWGGRKPNRTGGSSNPFNSSPSSGGGTSGRFN